MAAEALGAMALVGDDFAGESDPRVEAEMRDGGEHGVCRVGAGVQSADDAALIAGVADPGDVATRWIVTPRCSRRIVCSSGVTRAGTGRAAPRQSIKRST